MTEYNKPNAPRPLDLYEFSGILLPGLIVTSAVAILLMTRLPPQGMSLQDVLTANGTTVAIAIGSLVAMSFLVGHAIISLAVVIVNNFFLHKCIGRPHIWLLDPQWAIQRTSQPQNSLGTAAFWLFNLYIALYICSAIYLNIYKNRDFSGTLLDIAHVAMSINVLFMVAALWYRDFTNCGWSKAAKEKPSRTAKPGRYALAAPSIPDTRTNQPLLISLVLSIDGARALLEAKARKVHLFWRIELNIGPDYPDAVRKIIYSTKGGEEWDKEYSERPLFRLLNAPWRIKVGAILELLAWLIDATFLRVQRYILKSVGYFAPLPDYVRGIALGKIAANVPPFSSGNTVNNDHENMLLLHSLDDHCTRVAEDVVAKNSPHRFDRLVRIYNLFRIARNCFIATIIAALALAKAARVTTSNLPAATPATANSVVLPEWIAMLSLVMLALAVGLFLRTLHLTYSVYHKELFGSLLTISDEPNPPRAPEES